MAFLRVLQLMMVFTISQEGKVAAEQNLTFMLITSFGEFGFNSSGAIPAADLALDDINARADLLPGYRLVYDKPRNSQVRLAIYVYRAACRHATVINGMIFGLFMTGGG